MGKRKDSHDGENDAKTPRKVRKRTAVRKTNDKAVIKKVQENAINSPLLSLPGEVREKILIDLLGQKDIHIFMDQEEQPNVEEVDRANPKFGSVRYSVCIKPPPDGGSGRDNTRQFRKLHEDCRPFKACEHSESLHLAVLSASRKLFEEAHLILWKSNTFMFHQHEAFHEFFDSLNLSQRRKIRQVLFAIDIARADHWQLDSSMSTYIASLRYISEVTIILQSSLTFIRRQTSKPLQFWSNHFSEISSHLLGLASLHLERCSVDLAGKIGVYHSLAILSVMDKHQKITLGENLGAELLGSRGKERLQLEDTRKASQKAMNSAANASRARLAAHRSLLRACTLERNALRLRHHLQKHKYARKKRDELRREQQWSKECNEQTQHAIRRAKDTHARALRMNEQYRNIWKDKEWWNTIVDFYQVKDKPHWVLRPSLRRWASRKWSEKLESAWLEKAEGFRRRDVCSGSDSEDTNTNHDPDAEWYQDDKAILRRLFDFP